MKQTILITGATDGIGLEAAKILAQKGHRILLHGRSQKKMEAAVEALAHCGGDSETYLADLAHTDAIEHMVRDIIGRHDKLDVLINNAGVLRTPQTHTKDGLDVRFVVNTIAPYLLTRKLLPLMDSTGRVINLSSAAQATVNLQALRGRGALDTMEAYSQSKLALIMWTRALAKEYAGGPVMVSLNPGSLLGTKMVQEGFGIAGNDIGIGAEILVRAALSEEFQGASGQYFDNDAGHFASGHSDALDESKCQDILQILEEMRLE